MRMNFTGMWPIGKPLVWKLLVRPYIQRNCIILIKNVINAIAAYIFFFLSFFPNCIVWSRTCNFAHMPHANLLQFQRTNYFCKDIWHCVAQMAYYVQTGMMAAWPFAVQSIPRVHLRNCTVPVKSYRSCMTKMALREMTCKFKHPISHVTISISMEQ